MALPTTSPPRRASRGGQTAWIQTAWIQTAWHQIAWLRLRSVVARCGSPRSWYQGLLAALVVTSLVVPVQAAVFCNMAEQVMPTCCCGGGMDAAPGSTPEAPEAVDPPCCEQLGSEAVTTPSTPALDPPQIAFLATHAVVVVPATTSVRPTPRTMVLTTHARAPVVARGSPPRRGKLRARIGVMIC